MEHHKRFPDFGIKSKVSSTHNFPDAILHTSTVYVLIVSTTYVYMYLALSCCFTGGSLEPVVTSLESLQGCYDFLWNSAGLLAFVHKVVCVLFFS